MKTKQTNARNGKIEFFRFVFCIIIILFHTNRILSTGGSKEGYELGLFPRGYIGVEFFYFVSGYLMANSIFLTIEKKETMPFDREYWRFMWRKVLAILPYHLLAFALLFVQDWFFNKYNIQSLVKAFLSEIPGLLLLQRVGFNGQHLNSVEWYISAMLIAMAVIYIFCRRNFRLYSGVVAPVTAILLMGWIFFNCGAWSGAGRKMPLTLGYVSLFRAYAEINMGIFAFRIAKVLERETFSRGEKIFLELLEMGGYAIAIIYSLFAVPIRFESIPTLFLLISVALTFSKINYRENIWNQKVMSFLGKLSLPLYLNQLFAIYTVRRYAPDWSLTKQSVAILGIVAVLSLITMKIGDLMLVQIKKSHFNRMIDCQTGKN